MSTAAIQPGLVYSHIAGNRRKTVLVVAIAIASLIPFIGGVSFGVANLLAAYFGPPRGLTAQEQERISQVFAPTGHVRNEFDQMLERQLAETSRIREKRRLEVNHFRLEAMGIVAVGIAGLLGVLFWTLMRSPTSRILALSGARPPDVGENAVRRALEELAAQAGLPTPKLYIIDTSVPNALAAGMNEHHSVIAVTSGLLMLLQGRELEGVLAHELSHIGNRDTRLNTVVMNVALLLRLPHVMRRRRRTENLRGARKQPFRLSFRWMLSPLYIYVYLVAPVLAAVIRAAISRGREYRADADAALLTRFPEGLVRALAKIKGCGSALPQSNPILSHLYFVDPEPPGSAVRAFTGNLFATHPAIDRRIERLVESSGGIAAAVLEDAVWSGQDFGRAHPPDTATTDSLRKDEFSTVTAGNVMGRASRALTATRVYDQPDLKSAVTAEIKAGDLLVVFDDPGPFFQIITEGQTFGYIPRSVKLVPVDLLPAEVYDPVSRERFQAACSAQAAEAGNAAKSGLNTRQLAIALGFGVFCFAAIMLVMLVVLK